MITMDKSTITIDIKTYEMWVSWVKDYENVKAERDKYKAMYDIEQGCKVPIKGETNE